MTIRNHTKESVKAAAHMSELWRGLRRDLYSTRANMASNRLVKAIIWCVATDNASAVSAAATEATAKSGARSFFQFSTVDAVTNKANTPADAMGLSTRKRMVSSHSMGARMSTDVAA